VVGGWTELRDLIPDVAGDLSLPPIAYGIWYPLFPFPRHGYRKSIRKVSDREMKPMLKVFRILPARPPYTFTAMMFSLADGKLVNIYISCTLSLF
jgi:hypothetical protein